MRNSGKKNLLMVILLGIMPFFSVPLMAASQKELDALSERRRLLQEKEAEIGRKQRDLDVMQRYVGRLKDYRDQKLFSENGLVKKVDRWNADFSTWAGSWDEVVGLLATIDRTNVLDNFGRVQVLVRDQNEKLATLLNRAEEITSFAEHYNIQIDPLDEDLLKDQTELLQALNGNLTAAQGATDKVKEDFSKSSLQYLTDSVHTVSRLISDKLRALALAFPELNEKIVEARGAIAFIDNFSVGLHRFRLDSERVVMAIGQFRIFAAKSMLANLEKSADQLTTIIKSFADAPATFREDALAQVQATLVGTREHYQRVTSVASLSLIESKYAKRQRLMISRDCNDVNLVPQRNCELLRTLNALDLSFQALRQWSDADLAYLEERLDKTAQPASWQSQGGSNVKP